MSKKHLFERFLLLWSTSPTNYVSAGFSTRPAAKYIDDPIPPKSFCVWAALIVLFMVIVLWWYIHTHRLPPDAAEVMNKCMCLSAWCYNSESGNCGATGPHSAVTWMSSNSSFWCWLVMICQQFHSLLVYAGIAPLCFFFTIWYTGAAHRNGDIILSINVAASSTGCGSAQDDTRHKHWRTPKVEILLAVKAGQTALA